MAFSFRKWSGGNWKTFRQDRFAWFWPRRCMKNLIITEAINVSSGLSNKEIPVPFLDFRAAYLELKHEMDEAVSRVFQSGIYLLGRELESFEKEFAIYHDAGHCVGVGNGL